MARLGIAPGEGHADGLVERRGRARRIGGRCGIRGGVLLVTPTALKSPRRIARGVLDPGRSGRRVGDRDGLPEQHPRASVSVTDEPERPR